MYHIFNKLIISKISYRYSSEQYERLIINFNSQSNLKRFTCPQGSNHLIIGELRLLLCMYFLFLLTIGT